MHRQKFEDTATLNLEIVDRTVLHGIANLELPCAHCAIDLHSSIVLVVLLEWG
jgi:hypothetical protein